MNGRIKRDTSNVVYVDTDELAAALSIGKTSARRIGKEAGAFVKIGGSTRFNLAKVLDYIAQKEQSSEV